MSTAVLALGGNALARADEPATITNQFRHARESMAVVVPLAREGWRIVIVHGNGPQVGDSLVRNEVARRVVEPLPLGVLVAETAGWIGYMLQQSLQNALAGARVSRPVATVVTQTLVDRFDPAPSRPTARPLGVVEFPVIRGLLDQGVIVIAAGGGGPPVYDDPILGLEGVDAVVDKDRVSAVLAQQLEADVLLILTNVEAVYEGWGTPAARPIRRMTVTRAETLIASGAFDAGGMRPKVEAAAGFARDTGGRAIIAHLGSGPSALREETGTTIVRDT